MCRRSGRLNFLRCFHRLSASLPENGVMPLLFSLLLLAVSSLIPLSQADPDLRAERVAACEAIPKTQTSDGMIFTRPACKPTMIALTAYKRRRLTCGRRISVRACGNGVSPSKMVPEFPKPPAIPASSARLPKTRRGRQKSSTRRDSS